MALLTSSEKQYHNSLDSVTSTKEIQIRLCFLH
jgi:hypothetical protein